MFRVWERWGVLLGAVGAVLWVVAFIGMAGTIFCAFVTLVAKPANADGGRTE